MKNIRNNISGEVGTLIAIGSLIFIGFFSLISNHFLQKKQITKIKASTINCSEVYSIKAEGDLSPGKIITCIFETDGKKPRNMACGLSKNDGWPLGMLSASCSKTRCKAYVKIDNQIDENSKYELVAFDFDSQCGPGTGKRIALNISKNISNNQTQITQQPQQTPTISISIENKLQGSDQSPSNNDSQLESKITQSQITNTELKIIKNQECISNYADPNIEYRCEDSSLVPFIQNKKCLCVTPTPTYSQEISQCILENKTYNCSQPSFITETCEKKNESFLVEGERFKKVYCDLTTNSPFCKVSCKLNSDDDYSGNCLDDSTCITSTLDIRKQEQENNKMINSSNIQNIKITIECTNPILSYDSNNSVKEICEKEVNYVQKYDLNVYNEKITTRMIDFLEFVKVNDSSITISFETEPIRPLCKNITQFILKIGQVILPVYPYNQNNHNFNDLIEKVSENQTVTFGLVKCTTY